MNSSVPSPPRRGRPPKGAPSGKDALLTAALAQFSARGYDGTTIRDVAALAGVDSALIGRQFGSKGQLWDAVVDQLSEKQQVHLAEISALQADLSGHEEKALAELVRILVTISVEMPQFPALLAQIASESGSRFDEFRNRVIEPFLGACLPIISNARASGLIRSLEPRLFLGMLLSAISLPLLSPTLFLPESEPGQLQDQLYRQALWFVGLS